MYFHYISYPVFNQQAMETYLSQFTTDTLEGHEDRGLIHLGEVKLDFPSPYTLSEFVQHKGLAYSCKKLLNNIEQVEHLRFTPDGELVHQQFEPANSGLCPDNTQRLLSAVTLSDREKVDALMKSAIELKARTVPMPFDNQEHHQKIYLTKKLLTS